MITYLLIALIGVAAGILAGLFGAGGGIIIVPGLALIFKNNAFPEDVIMQMAIGTSLAVICFTAIASIHSHHQRHMIDWVIVRRLLLGLILGTFLGALVASALSTQILQKIFGIFLILVAINMYISLPEKNTKSLPSSLGLGFMGFCTGSLAGLLGLGGGILIVPLLTYFNVSLPKAFGISAACGFPIAIFGTMTFIWSGWHLPNLPHLATGYVYWPAVLAIALFSMLSVRIGAFLALYLPMKIVKSLFVLLVISMAIKMLWTY